MTVCGLEIATNRTENEWNSCNCCETHYCVASGTVICKCMQKCIMLIHTVVANWWREDDVMSVWQIHLNSLYKCVSVCVHWPYSCYNTSQLLLWVSECEKIEEKKQWKIIEPQKPIAVDVICIFIWMAWVKWAIGLAFCDYTNTCVVYVHCTVYTQEWIYQCVCVCETSTVSISIIRFFHCLCVCVFPRAWLCVCVSASMCAQVLNLLSINTVI